MGHGTGRHRRRRRRWADRMRGAAGAVLAAIAGVRPAPSRRPKASGGPTPTSRPEPTGATTTRSDREPEWVRRYDEARRSRADRSRTFFTESDERNVANTPARLPETGWCVDEDGVRAVRPYLVAHEQNQRAEQRYAGPRTSHQGRSVLNVLSERTGSETPDEWAELARLIRRWDALRVPAV